MSTALIGLYERIGHASNGEHAYDTEAAQDTGRIVQARAERCTPTRDQRGAPSHRLHTNVICRSPVPTTHGPSRWTRCGDERDTNRRRRPTRRRGAPCGPAARLTDALSQPRAQLAGVQRARARAGARSPAPAARTRQVPRHRRHQPRRVLHDSRRGAAEAAAHAPRARLARRPDDGTAARARPRAGAADARRAGAVLDRRAAAGARRARDPVPRPDRVLGRPSRPISPDYFRARDRPGAHAAGLRSRASVSAHLQPQQEPRGRRQARGPDEVRARQAAARAAALHASCRRRWPAVARRSCSSRTSSAPTSSRSSRARRSRARTSSASSATPTW